MKIYHVKTVIGLVCCTFMFLLMGTTVYNNEQVGSGTPLLENVDGGDNSLASLNTSTPTKETIHVALITDINQIEGLPVVINSILVHTKSPVQFHIVTCSLTFDLKTYLQCFRFPTKPRVELIVFPLDYIDETYSQYMTVQARRNNKRYLVNPANFARFFLHRLLPHVTRIIYLDLDTVVQRDLTYLWDLTRPHTTIFSIPLMKRPDPQTSLMVPAIYYRKYKRDIDKEKLDRVNCGVVVANMTRWRQMDKQVEEELHFWMNKGIEKNLWPGSTQPIMILAAHEEITPVNSTWNGLTFLIRKDEKLEQAAILHYAAPHKVWTGKGTEPMKLAFWTRMKPQECMDDTYQCSYISPLNRYGCVGSVTT